MLQLLSGKRQVMSDSARHARASVTGEIAYKARPDQRLLTACNNTDMSGAN
ncbi:hypothetical protein VAWG006_21920 [Aeromonas enteropelogenes]|nr:hypothetical protein VAWG006_21920 [Aeromonas enteropelogenes]BEE22103.1 hypothetical protein VAWG007_21980 [Aeromonas enteropelogenes]